MQTRPTLVDSFVKYDTRLAKLKEELLRAKREHDGREQGLEESEEVKMQEAACPKCRGDGAETRDIPHITDLCPADKKRIAELVGKLAKCTQERNKAESELAICREKNKALENRYRIFLNRHEDETSALKSRLSDATTKTNKLQLQTSHSLDLLSRQIQIQETQFKELSDSVWVLLREKMQLQNLAIEKEARAKVAEAKIERMKEKLEMEKLVFLKEQAKNLIVATYDKSCQTREDLANARASATASRSDTTFETCSENSQSRMQIKQIKSEDDLDAPSSEAALVRELFFKHPDVDDVLNMTSVFPLIHTLD